MSDESIRSNLRHSGWTEVQVTEGFTSVDKSAESMNTDSGVYNTTEDYSSGAAVGLSGSSVEEKKPFSKKKMLKITAVTILILALIAGGIGGYYLINPTLTKYLALKDLGKIESAKVQGRIVMKEANSSIDNETASDFALKFLLDGYLDIKEAKSDLTAKMEVPVGYVSPEIKARTIQNKVYFNLSNFPIPETEGQPKLQDTWYYYEDEKDDKEEKQSNSNKQSWNIDLEKYFGDGKIFKDFRKITDESSEGVDCNQYVYEVDIARMADIIIQIMNENGSIMTESEKMDFKNEVAKLKSINGSMLIGKEDKMIHRVDISISAEDYVIDVTLKISEINKKHTFKEPEGAVSILDALGLKEQLLPILPINSDNSARSPI